MPASWAANKTESLISLVRLFQSDHSFCAETPKFIGFRGANPMRRVHQVAIFFAMSRLRFEYFQLVNNGIFEVNILAGTSPKHHDLANCMSVFVSTELVSLVTPRATK